MQLQLSKADPNHRNYWYPEIMDALYSSLLHGILFEANQRSLKRTL